VGTFSQDSSASKGQQVSHQNGDVIVPVNVGDAKKPPPSPQLPPDTHELTAVANDMWQPLKNRQVVRSVLRLGAPLNVARMRVPLGESSGWCLGNSPLDCLQYRWGSIRQSMGVKNSASAWQAAGNSWVPRMLARQSLKPAPVCSFACFVAPEQEHTLMLRAGMKSLGTVLGTALSRRDRSLIQPELGSPLMQPMRAMSAARRSEMQPIVSRLQSEDSIRSTVFIRFDDLKETLNSDLLMFDGILLVDIRTAGAAWGMIQVIEGAQAAAKELLVQSLHRAKARGIDVGAEVRRLWLQFAPDDGCLFPPDNGAQAADELKPKEPDANESLSPSARSGASGGGIPAMKSDKFTIS